MRIQTSAIFLKVLGALLVASQIIFFIYTSLFWGYGDTDGVAVAVVGLILISIGLILGWLSDPNRLIRSAEIEFASGNIATAMEYYKKAGDLEKIQECAALLNQQQSAQLQQPMMAQQSGVISPEPVMSVSDSVVSGDVHYHINQPAAGVPVSSSEPEDSVFVKVFRVIFIIIVVLFAIVKISVEIMT